MQQETIATVGLAEDQPHVLQGLLRDINWEDAGLRIAFAAGDGDSALQKLIDCPPDVLITDISMPGKSGLELARYAHEHRLFTKVIILTAYDDFTFARNALQHGVFDYLLKPVEYPALLGKCREAVIQSQAEAAIRYQVKKAIPTLRERFYCDVVEGKLTVDEQNEQSRFLGVRLDSSQYRCGIIGIESLGETQCAEDREVLLYKLQQDLLEIRLEEGHVLCAFRMRSNRLAFLLGLSGCKNGQQNILYARLKEMIEIYRQKHYALLTISLGSIVSDRRAIPHSFADAELVDDYRFRLDRGEIYDCTMLPLTQSGTNVLPFDLQEQVLKWVFLCDEDELQASLENVRSYFSSGNLQKEMIQTFYLDAYLRLQYQAVSAGVSPVEPMVMKGHLMEELMTLTGLESIADWFSKQCRLVCAAVLASHEHHYHLLIKQVDEYVQAHFHSNELNLEKIASYVGMNTSYLSSVYKKRTGKGINETLAEKRLTEAKKRLATTNNLVQDIAFSSGFSNQYYFSAWFKKQTGVTPNEYRTKKILARKNL